MKFSNRDISIFIGVLVAIIISLTALWSAEMGRPKKAVVPTATPAGSSTSLNRAASELVELVAARVSARM